ncbi:MAG TPA: maleylpyruvate isomerase N-terminal domain-containing protein [Acidimicrobiales bacterium]|nr:maleylpyruvate isomerase N-terminal domain-containing protein [Acidimicrobiales bacterium]
MAQSREIVELFLEGARVVSEAVADPAVVAAWDRPSVLEEQLVSGLAGHLARGGVWAVGEYLDAGTPAGPVDFESAGQYFAAFAASASPDDHRAIRDRGVTVASIGHEALVETLHTRLDALTERLKALDGSQLIAVIAGKVLRLNDYLTTRIVEQTVHLDDLARSVGRDPWPIPPEAQALTISVGTEIACLTTGTTALIRALYRRGLAAEALPVL